MSASLPAELEDDIAARDFESWWMRLCWRTLPLGIFVTWVLVGRYPKTIMFLQAPNDWSALLSAKVLIAAVAFPAMTMLLWYASQRLGETASRSAQGIAAVVLVLLALVGLGVIIQHPRATFLVREAVKARAVQANFVRNMAFKQELLHQPSPPPTKNTPRVMLVGSSQINLGIEPENLRERCGADQVIAACMPGMVPTQYLAMANRLGDQHPTHVVCWLSEFDFFRENTLPVIRMRWLCDGESVTDLVRVMTAGERLQRRGELADLTLAAAAPTWRFRSMIQLIAFRFWWRWDQDPTDLNEDEKRIGGRLIDKQAGVTNARQNIRRTSLVELNFRAFERFAQIVTSRGATLVVLEGESHPDTMRVYPSEFRTETRQRLSKLADTIGFEYVSDEELPTFQLTDWRDAVHLNELGREKLTQFVAARLQSRKKHPIHD